MKIYDFFIWLCCLVALYNNMLKIFHLRDDFFILLYKATKRLSQIKINQKFSSLVFIVRPETKCTNVKKPFSYFRLGHLMYVTGMRITQHTFYKIYDLIKKSKFIHIGINKLHPLPHNHSYVPISIFDILKNILEKLSEN